VDKIWGFIVGKALTKASQITIMNWKVATKEINDPKEEIVFHVVKASG